MAPRATADEDNRCVAVGPARALSLRQQELVCLKTAHAECPRYRRGAVLPAAAPPGGPRVEVPRATFVALLVLVLSAGISFGFVLQRGGIDLPVARATPSPSGLAVVPSGSPVASVGSSGPAAPSPEPSVSPRPSASPGPTASASPEPTPSATPKPTPRPTPKPTPKPTPSPTTQPTPGSIPSASRLALLTPCPDQIGCYVYVIRNGDALWSIANWFGVPLATVKSWNPWVLTAGVHAGNKLKIPTPTR